MRYSHRPYLPYKFKVKEVGRPARELDVQPCLRHYRFVNDVIMDDYRLLRYENTRLKSMLSIWEKAV